MQEHDLSWVRVEMALAQPAPRNQVGPTAWMRNNLFSTPVNTVLTAIAIIAVAWFVCSLIAAFKAYDGQPYRYPITIRLFK